MNNSIEVIEPAIVAVGYNRPAALKRLLQSIDNAKYTNNNVTLIISIDKANNENDVLEVADSFSWNHGQKIIRTFDQRQGLRKHIIQCGDLSIEYGAVIILEDDLIVSPNFYEYTKSAIRFYQNDELITGIALYSHEWNGYAHKFFCPIADKYDTYLGQFSITWGQCWTSKWWSNFRQWYVSKEDKLGTSSKIPNNINNWSNQSWGRYFINYMIERDLYYVIPRISLSTNCSEIGQHAKQIDNEHQVRLLNADDYNYEFSPTNDSQRYDVFFENMNLLKYFSFELTKEGIVIDLAGIGRSIEGKRYYLTTRDLPYEIIEEYALQLRPIDMNIICANYGRGIKLYDTTKKRRNKKNDFDYVTKYEIRGISNRTLLRYSLHMIVNKIIRKGN